MASYKVIATVDYLGIQAMFFPTKKIGSTTYFFADKYWMFEIGSRRWGFRSFKRIDHLPPTITIRGQLIPVDSLKIAGSRVMYGNVVVGAVKPGGALVSDRGGALVSDLGGALIGDQGSGIISDHGGGVVSDHGLGRGAAGVISDNGLGRRGAGVISDYGLG